jgi:hypothetical protein
MKRVVLALVLPVLLNSSVAFAQAPPAQPSPDDVYLAMVDRAMLNAPIDWAEMRKAYAKSSFYSDFSQPSVSEEYYKAGKSAAAAPLMRQNFKDMQRQQFGNVNAHVWAIKIGKELPSEAIKVEDEQKVLESIADSIVEGGADGSSASKAYTVVSADEEKMVVETMLQQKIGTTTPMGVGGHKFDIVTYTDPATKKSVKLYFNTDFVPPKKP